MRLPSPVDHEVWKRATTWLCTPRSRTASPGRALNQVRTRGAGSSHRCSIVEAPVERSVDLSLERVEGSFDTPLTLAIAPPRDHVVRGAVSALFLQTVEDADERTWDGYVRGGVSVYSPAASAVRTRGGPIEIDAEDQPLVVVEQNRDGEARRRPPGHRVHRRRVNGVGRTGYQAAPGSAPSESGGSGKRGSAPLSLWLVGFERSEKRGSARNTGLPRSRAVWLMPIQERLGLSTRCAAGSGPRRSSSRGGISGEPRRGSRCARRTA